MEADTAGINQMSGVAPRLFPAVGPVLLISMGYIDPGKWSAAVEGGARFGFDLVLLLLVFNFAAILCQYLAARIGIVTGKNLAQICSEEYDKSTCVFLGVQAELSVFVLDLTMILGIAHGLNLLFGVNLFASLFFAATDALLFPLLDTLLEKCKAEVLFVRAAGFVLLSYVLGVLISQPEIPLVLNGMLTGLTGESAFTLMGLLGANIMPHNFYLHSFVVQQKNLEPPNVSKSTLCHDHFFAIVCIFSGIFLVNYVVMSSAATVFHSAGLVVLTFQDVLLLMDQVFGSPVAPFAFFLILFISSHITGLSWNLGGQVVLRDLLRMDLPVWLHRATIRVLAIVLALYCTWSSGAEGLYQLLIFTQVLLAMMLPSSVVPLFRVASSRSIMGVYRISQFLEFLALITLIGMLGLNIIFVVELLFGNSDWVGSLKWNLGSSIALPYVLLLITACASLVLMLWLAATPLKSATLGPDAQVWKWDSLDTLAEPSAEVAESEISKLRYHEEPVAEEPALEKSVESFSDTSVVEYDFDLPEAIMDSDQEPHLPEPHLPKIEDNSTTGQCSPTCHLQESTSKVELASVEIVDKEVSDAGLLDVDTLQKIESADPVGQSVGADGDLQNVKDADEGDTWDPEQSSTGASGNGPALASEGSGSFRSLSGKTDDGGNGSGSLSRLSGLGRAARRQLAAILDEFWGQLYDHHGQATQEARAKKLDMLFGVDINLAVSSLRVDSAATGSPGYFPSVAERAPAFLVNSSIYDSPKQQRMPLTVESPYGVQTGSSLSTHMQFLDDFVQSSSRNMFDSSEKRYSSLRLPPSSEGWNYQPATVHGYQMSSYLSRMATDRNSDSLNTVLDPPTPKSPSSSSFGRANYKDPHSSSALGQVPQNRISSIHASITQNPVMARGSRMQADRPYYNPSSSGPGDNVGSPAYTKKYHSLPDIKGLVRPHRDSNVVERISQLGGPPGFGPPVGRAAYEKSLHSNVGSRTGVPSVYGELSPPKLYRDPFYGDLNSNSDAKSLWSRQPSEQLFGMDGKSHMVGKEGRGPSLIAPDAAFHAELESKMLQSFRNCILKLLKLEGSEWLFRFDGGADEDLIDRVAARERFNYETEIKEINQVLHINESLYISSDRKFSSLKNEEAALAKFLGSPLSHCGEACIWRVDLIVSFGVWCIHRILELSLMESRPELWGKYTYVLNRLQGVLDPAFSKPRIPQPPCTCLQVPAAHAKRSSSPLQNGLLPPAAAKLGSRGKCTSASALLDIIKDVEIAVSCRKGRTGTVAGDVAFPKGKENLASVLKRYKRRLTNKAVGSTLDGGGSGLLRKVPIPSTYGL
ncbi:Natural resistance-associated macrophage like [Macleaya cordata]|uniref:Natural resistance-associated macrophage like n=1 Tax=Macleaya cordata TaxID=56857 RepID=A0A200R5Q1_MACCD|nr:Natural resistance-associated macrophage like [Macleaya cordata]